MFRFIFRDVLTIDGATVCLSNAIIFYIKRLLLRYLKRCSFFGAFVFIYQSHSALCPFFIKNEINEKMPLKLPQLIILPLLKVGSIN